MASSLPLLLLLLLLCFLGVAHSYLQVYNMRARNLRPDKYSRPDCYVKVYYGSRIMGQTRVRFGNRDPSWTESIPYYSARVNGRVRVSVYDKDAVFDDFLGSCSAPIKRGTYNLRCNLSKGGTMYFTYRFN